MAINTTYGAGDTTTATKAPALSAGADDLSFWREMANRQMMAQRKPKAAPMMGAAPRGASGGGGGSTVRRPMPAPSRQEGQGGAGRHSWVTNIKGGPQVMGGMVSSGFGASPGNTFYGGWDPTAEASGPTRFENLPSAQQGPMIVPGMDPAMRARLVNSGLPSPDWDPMGRR